MRNSHLCHPGLKNGDETLNILKPIVSSFASPGHGIFVELGQKAAQGLNSRSKISDRSIGLKLMAVRG